MGMIGVDCQYTSDLDSGGRTLDDMIGSVLNDDQIAGVLTYIRREWGQTGTPVDPAQVRTVREQNASRFQGTSCIVVGA